MKRLFSLGRNLSSLAGAVAVAMILVFASIHSAASAEGGFVNPGAGAGGFSGPGPEISTVAQAKEMRDDARVLLRGNIIQHLGGEDYLFQDSTGTITVEIDDRRWMGQSVAPADTVEIYGEVDRDWRKVEIDVKRIVKK